MFNLEEREDFIFYLRDLIVRVHTRLKRYKRYLDSINEDINKYRILEKEDVIIPAFIYEEHADKYGNCLKHLSNLIADNSKSAMSYLKFRKFAEKKDFGFVKLDQKTSELLNNINTLRNWSLHIPESMLNAQLEVAGDYYKKIPYSPIPVANFEYYEGIWLTSLYYEAEKHYNEIRIIFQQMKKDYSILIGESVRVYTQQFRIRQFDKFSIDVPTISMKIQKGKYKK